MYMSLSYFIGEQDAVLLVPLSVCRGHIRMENESEDWRTSNKFDDEQTKDSCCSNNRSSLNIPEYLAKEFY